MTNKIALFVFVLSSAFFLQVLPVRAQVVAAPTCGVAGRNSPDGTSFGCRPAPKRADGTYGSGGKKTHKGADFSCHELSPLTAAFAGTLHCAYGSVTDGGAGNRCTLTGQCITVKYFHMSPTGFQPYGAKAVAAGDPIGNSGTSGGVFPNGTLRHVAPHLHFEVHVGSYGPVDPQYFFSKEFREKYGAGSICGNVAAMEDLAADAHRQAGNCPWNSDFISRFPWSYNGAGAPDPTPPPQQDAETADETDSCSFTGVEGKETNEGADGNGG